MKAIKRADLITSIENLGLIARNVECITITPFEIRATLFVRSEDGQKVLKVDGVPQRRVEVFDVIN